MRKKFAGIATLALTAAMSTNTALAQSSGTVAPAAGQTAADEIVVTGSHIRGTPTDAAMPVSVINRSAMQAVGNPTLLELVRTLGASQGMSGEFNVSQSNRQEGLANINLRGLGPARTLVLINGQREAPAGFPILEFGAQQFVDINSIPLVAIDRLEVLKDGAAATYGSDAVAGVVNFITRSHFDGLDIGGSWKLNDSDHIAGDHADWDANAIYGWQGERSSWVTSVAYVRKDRIPMTDVDWALRPFAQSGLVGGNAQAGLWSSTTNPGSYSRLAAPYNGYANVTQYPTTPPTTTGAKILDPECSASNTSFAGGPGGEWGPVFANGACRFNSIAFTDLQEEETRYQIFSEFNHDFGDGAHLHLEGLYAHGEAGFRSSPSFPPPIQAFSFEPTANPGVQDLIAYLNSTGQSATANQIIANGGVVFNGRAFGPGIPSNHPAIIATRRYETTRLAGSYTGSFDSGFLKNVDYDFHLTWSRAEAGGAGEDIVADRFRLALLGLGGPGCDPATGTPGVGACQWLNTYSSAQYAHVLGQSTVNTFNYNPAHANSASLTSWLYDKTGFTATNTLTVGEAVFSGETGWRLAGGPAHWAAGGQLRAEQYQLDPTPLANLNLNPCPRPGDTTCGTAAGVFQFSVGWRPVMDSRVVKAVFGELSLPVTDDLSVQLAARYESYPGDTGDSLDPKIQVRWKPAQFLVLRGSAQTTFRAPSLNQLSDTSSSQSPFGTIFIPFDTVGNRALRPETSFSYNLGAVLDFHDIGGSHTSFHASLDYWNFDLEDPIVREGSAPITSTAQANTCAPGTLFYDRLTFAPGTSTGCSNVTRLRVNLVNGAEVQTDGLDAAAALTFDDVAGGSLSLAMDATYILDFDVGQFVGPNYVIKAFSALGYTNRSDGQRPLPQWKGNASLSYMHGPHRLTLSAHYVTDYQDERYVPGLTVPGFVANAPALAHIDSMLTVDASYNVRLPWDVNATFSVYNIGDQKPPDVYNEVFYDSYTANPYGRMIKIGITKHF